MRPNLYQPGYLKWVVVGNAGMDNEYIHSSHRSFKSALEELKISGGREEGFDIMRRLPDGTLTAEY